MVEDRERDEREDTKKAFFGHYRLKHVHGRSIAATPRLSLNEEGSQVA
jgi:hypothetical protein